MVKYYIERHNQYRAKKLKFLEQMRQDDDGMITDKDREIFTQLSMTSNAETRLESLGFRVGYSLVEKLSKDLPRFTTELEMMKFICKEFWTKAFGKQVDNLRTNHQDVYVVQDNKFLTVANLAEGGQYLKDAAIYLSFPAGIVRGALANLGIKCICVIRLDTWEIKKI
uniref:Trafficking protein particle complex subunit 6B n=1 Tax=Panagrolaimus sp. JU765 TaxID=591449 RepID=A0AC34QIC1_9BILA